MSIYGNPLTLGGGGGGGGGNPFSMLEFVPKDSWCQSDNATHTYNFSGTTNAGEATTYCLSVMAQNGDNPSYASDIQIVSSGTDGNGSYAYCYGPYTSGDSASTYSGGNNGNNSQIICMEFSKDIHPTLTGAIYYHAATGENPYRILTGFGRDSDLLLIIMRGGTENDASSVTGLTKIATTTAADGRFNDVYCGRIKAGGVLSISAPFGGSGAGGQLLVLSLYITL